MKRLLIFLTIATTVACAMAAVAIRPNVSYLLPSLTYGCTSDGPQYYKTLSGKVTETSEMVCLTNANFKQLDAAIRSIPKSSQTIQIFEMEDNPTGYRISDPSDPEFDIFINVYKSNNDISYIDISTDKRVNPVEGFLYDKLGVAEQQYIISCGFSNCTTTPVP